MKKYLIFRTDRVGDFLLTLSLIKLIKSNDPQSTITVIASKKNFKYIESFDGRAATVLLLIICSIALVFAISLTN